MNNDSINQPGRDEEKVQPESNDKDGVKDPKSQPERNEGEKTRIPSPEIFKDTIYKTGSINKVMSELGPYLNLGVQIAITVGVCAIIGWWLDKQLGTQPILLLICSLGGVVLGMYNFFRNISELEKRKKTKK
jgi:F0F1-type ATP synthase assembly protein I